MHIEADDERADVEVSLIGAQRWTINDVSIRQFGITKEKLRTGVQALTGSRPDDVFLRDPAGDFGNIFATNGFNQTTAVLRPITHSLTKLERNKYLHDTKYILNVLLDQYFGISVNISSYLRDLTTNTWSGVSVNTSVPISYRIRLNQYIPLFYSSIWGVREDITRTSLYSSLSKPTIPSDTDMHLDLYDRRINARVNVVYRSNLEGNVVGLWRGPAGPVFQAFDVNEVLTRSGLPSTVNTEEVINMDYSMGTTFVFRYGNHTQEVVPNYTVTVLN